jgi:rubrerythrin
MNNLKEFILFLRSRKPLREHFSNQTAQRISTVNLEHLSHEDSAAIMSTSFVCPVCGFPDLTEQPRYADGGSSDEICPSCGFQFGYDDDDRGSGGRIG